MMSGLQSIGSPCKKQNNKSFTSFNSLFEHSSNNRQCDTHIRDTPTLTYRQTVLRNTRRIDMSGQTGTKIQLFSTHSLSHSLFLTLNQLPRVATKQTRVSLVRLSSLSFSLSQAPTLQESFNLSVQINC